MSVSLGWRSHDSGLVIALLKVQKLSCHKARETDMSVSLAGGLVGPAVA